MLYNYNDILNLTNKKPLWHDECGVPRFCEFSPKEVNNIYAREVVLLLISCANCGKSFKVALSQSNMDLISYPRCDDVVDYDSIKFSNNIKSLHYGDPPYHKDISNGLCVGCTENCNDLYILEFWQKDVKWKRRKDLEGELC